MKQRILLTLTLLGLFLVNAQAQDDTYYNPIQTGVTSLSIAPDARGGALGEVGAATDPDVHSQYWNPAKYPFCVSRAGVAANFTPWLRKLVSDINLANLTGYYRIGDYQAISSSLRYFTLGEVTLQSANMTIKPYEMAFDVAYSRMLSEQFSAAVALRYIYSDLTYDYSDQSSGGSAFAADIAMYWNTYIQTASRESNLAIGLNISNIGSKITFGGSNNSEFINTNLRLGLNYMVPINEYNRISFCADANKLLVPSVPKKQDGEKDEDYQRRLQSDYYDVGPIAGIFKSFSDAPGGFKEELEEIQWSVGAEYVYNDRFALRAGYHHEAANKGNRKYFTVGAGFHMNVFSLDAGYVFSTAQSNPLDGTMRFSLSFDMDGIRDLFNR